MTDARDFARREAARDMVRRAACLLAPSQIAVAPLKGAMVAIRYVPASVPRPLTDVDLLVPSDRFDEAAARLISGGGHVLGGDRDDRTVSLAVPWGPLPIDLHRRLFQRGVFRCDEATMLARARVDESLYGAPVLLLHRHDVIAHALGHHAAGRPVVARARVRTDLEHIAAGVPLELDGLATDLASMGLTGAVHFAERDLRDEPLAWLAELAARLPRGALGAIATELAVRIARSDPDRSSLDPRLHGAWVSISRHLVNDGLARALVSSAIHVRQHLASRRADASRTSDARGTRGTGRLSRDP